MADKDLPTLVNVGQPQGIGSLLFQAEKYLDYVDDPSLTEDQKNRIPANSLDDYGWIR